MSFEKIVDRRPGLVEMDLLRLVFEHARNGNDNQAVDCIASRLVVDGQGGTRFRSGAAQYHNSFNIVDPHGAAFRETPDGHWVVREVERNNLLNHIGIGTDWDKCAVGLESFGSGEGD